MTNATIILNEACNLFEQGLLKGTGKYIKMMYIDENGNEIEKEVELPEDIHTFAGWKALGYSVKKGEKAVSKFPIWKYVKAKASEAEDANADGEASGHCIMKVAAFFLGIAGAAELTDAWSSTGRRCLPLPVKYILEIG